ncbi:lipoyl(octanoyl) transferase LipB [Enterobacteriaceae endosymbiont of Neohaemonia nigricornis]|uniref:lipoyl(octanoyl) transferase LipB n=1 Tax=Enterobacteriaceae endosymbiont of Neohaemonia nigricornis TaxID=2675792 RepID=UPI0014496F5A|nr:lipoyl(octanoyl) transferase LipB [Enterobacteriaceae endosymbiont of Neohaemonia nigricornis]QJC30270.1 lipoyl(octanoyl) transferase LipB [Enterobacteriaceae endosymbiont of Neohaemonia nigricornis]
MYNKIIIRYLGIEPWNITYNKMYNFNINRTNNTLDEIWLVEHTPVFTKGKTSVPDDMKFNNHNIPIFLTDRGGKITYHAPGQQIMYILLNLKKKNINIKKIIFILEKTIINTLLYFNIYAQQGSIIYNNPGIYYNTKKIASIGLKISKGCTLHGLALNVKMNMRPFSYINPCGLKNLKMIQIKNFIPNIKMFTVKKILIHEFISLLYS